MRNYDQYTKQLLTIAQKNHTDAYNALGAFLDYLLDTFEMKNITKFALDYEKVFLDARKRDADYFALMCSWFVEVIHEMENEQGWLDFFGKVYEETFKSKSKASALGQFYTPDSICDLMADMTIKGEFETANDCACGSGRTMLALFAKSDKTQYHYYTAGDIDLISVKMCALNFMVHGMIGEVKQQDALLQSTPHVIYKINEVRCPFPTPFYSIRLVSGNEIKNKKPISNGDKSMNIADITAGKENKKKKTESLQLTLDF